MNRMFLVSMYDKRANTFFRPTAVPAVAVALRDVEVDMKRPESILAASPDDFELHVIGTFDIENGTVAPLEIGAEGVEFETVFPVSAFVKEQ